MTSDPILVDYEAQRSTGVQIRPADGPDLSCRTLLVPQSQNAVLARGLGLTRYSQPLPLADFQTFGDTLRSGRRRIHETTIERQDASAIHRLTPRRSFEDDRDGARTREQAHSARLR